MQILNIEISEYEALRNRAESAEKKVTDLKQKLIEQEDKHQTEIDELVNNGKVRYIDSHFEPFSFFARTRERIRNFEDVKEEVYQHFKQGIFKEELDKARKEIAPTYEGKMAELRKIITEKTDTIKRLEAENESLVNRGFWARLTNKI